MEGTNSNYACNTIGSDKHRVTQTRVEAPKTSAPEADSVNPDCLLRETRRSQQGRQKSGKRAAAERQRSKQASKQASKMLAAARRSGLGMARVGSPLWRAAFSTSGVTEDGAGVLLTKKGAERLLELQKRKNNDKLMLRLAVEGGGCSGFSYVFNVTDEEPNDDDIVFEHHGQKVVVDDISLDLVRGSKIDFTEDLIRRSFEVIDNPNAETGCGCGSSFAAKMEF